MKTQGLRDLRGDEPFRTRRERDGTRNIRTGAGPPWSAQGGNANQKCNRITSERVVTLDLLQSVFGSMVQVAAEGWGTAIPTISELTAEVTPAPREPVL